MSPKLSLILACLSSRSQKSKVNMLAGICPIWRLQGTFLLPRFVYLLKAAFRMPWFIAPSPSSNHIIPTSGSGVTSPFLSLWLRSSYLHLFCYCCLEFELRAPCLLGRRSTTWATLPAPCLHLVRTLGITLGPHHGPGWSLHPKDI
jgi:hypothetical protein